MAKTNIEHLRDILTTDEQNEFLAAIVNEQSTKVVDFEQTIDTLKDDIREYKKDNRDLRQQLDELQEADFDGHEIITPIGSIKYETTGSLDLVHLMEAFGRLMQEQGPTELLRHFEETFAV